MLSIKIANVAPNHYVYPAIIEQTDENYCLYFPDLPGCVASGDTVEKAVELAQSAAQEYLWELEHDNEEIPTASKAEDVRADERPGGFVKLIELDADALRPAKKIPQLSSMAR